MNIPKNYQSEISIFTAIAKKFSGQTKSFEQVFTAAKKMRLNASFDLTPFEQLAPKTQKNFENRLARFLAGTEESANFTQNKQPKIFNIENVLGKKCTEWVFPINPIERLSPQIKKSGQKFRFPDLK